MDPRPNIVRVVVADHQPMHRAAVVALLEASPGLSVVGEAANGAEAIHVALATHPDVVLMDVRLPVLDGIAATRQLLGAHDTLTVAHPRIIALCDAGADEYVYEAIRMGARGFVSRDARPAELVEAVRVAADDVGVPWPEETVRLIARFTPSRAERDELAGRRAALSTGDAIVAVGVGRGHDDHRIAANLGITATEVQRRVRALVTTLGLRDRTQLVVFAYESGLLTPTTGPREAEPHAGVRQA